MKAYAVTTDWNPVSVLVFATTVSKAKALALGSYWMCDEEWTDLRAKREPKADRHADQYGSGHLDANDEAQCNVLRDLGWYEIDGDSLTCSECGLYPWRLVADSVLDEDRRCARCLTGKVEVTP